MGKFKVTVRRRVVETREIEVEARNSYEANFITSRLVNAAGKAGVAVHFKTGWVKSPPGRDPYKFSSTNQSGSVVYRKTVALP